MRTKILVEGFELDLTDNVNCELSYVIDDVKDFGSKNTNYSKTIVIQGSQKNNKIFNHLSELARYIAVENVNIQAPNVNSNYIASLGSNCVILVDNIQIFKGKLRVLEVVNKVTHIEYECAVFGELGGFYYELSKGVSTDNDLNSAQSTGTKLLQHINFNDLDHTWNWLSISNSWNNWNAGNYGTGYFYPLIDYGNVRFPSHWHEQALRPALYVKEIVDRIFAMIGYTYDCPFFDSEFYKRLIIPNNQELLRTYSSRLMYIYTNFGQSSSVSTIQPILWYSGTFSDFNSIGSGQYQYTGINPILNGLITLQMNIMAELYANCYYDIWVYKNGAPYYKVDRISFSGSAQDTSLRKTYYNSSNIVWIDLNVGDIIEIRYDLVNVSGNPTSITWENSWGQSIWQFDSSVTQLTQAIFNLDVITMNGAVPQGIKITDFFTSILKMFNLYVLEDKVVEKKLVITPYIDFYQNVVDDTLDWSNKLDRGQEIRLKPMGELNARVFNFKYKDDASYWNKVYKDKYAENYMDFSYDSLYEYAKDKEDLEVIFSSTVNYAPNGEDKIVPYFANYEPVNGTPVESSTNIRILQSKMLPCNSWDLKLHNGGNIANNITEYAYSGMWDNPITPSNGIFFESLGWASPREVYYNLTDTSPNMGLFNVYWSRYFAEITNPSSMIMTAYFKLNMIDIRLLDFSKNIMIDGSLWRINKIMDYNPLADTTTKVELLKIIDTIY